MFRKLRRLANPEIALGFLVATVFWMGVLGWQAAHAPTEIEKQKCYDAAQQSGHKSEECKSLWERTTSDPVAFFTFWLVIFTAVLGGSTILLYITGEKQIGIAKKSVDTAERALVAGDRAFVFVTFGQSPVVDAQTQRIQAWNFTPVWNNAGNTPTRNMVNHISIMVSDEELPKDWGFPDTWPPDMPPNERIRTPLALGPKGTANGQTVGVSIDVFDDIVEGKKFIYMWGWATYDDVFPDTRKHVTRFGVRIYAGGNPRKHDRMTFTYIFLRKFNCSDEECDLQGFPADWTPRATTV